MPNQPQNEIPVSVEELHKIVHGLKMAPLAFVEEKARNEIEEMIKLLPSAEALEQFGGDENSLSKLKEMIGNIMRLIEVYGNRDPEFKARYKARTGLPPRYKVLDWRNAMTDSDLIKVLVRVSSIADDALKGDIASHLIKCAKNASDKDEIRAVISELRENGLEVEADIVHNAAFEGMKSMFQHNYVAKIDKQLNDAIARFEQSMDTATLLNETEQLQKWVQKVEGMSNPQDKEYARRYTQYIEQLQNKANEFNNRLYGEFEQFIAKTKQEIANLSGQVAREAPTEEVQEMVDTDGDGVPDSPAEEVVEAPSEVAQETRTQPQPVEQAQPAQSTQSGAELLNTLDDNTLNSIIYKSLPDVWNKGFNGKAVGQMTAEEKKQAILQGVGEKSLPQIIEMNRAASGSLTILQKGASVEWTGGSGKIAGFEEGQYLIETSGGATVRKGIDEVQIGKEKTVAVIKPRKDVVASFNLNKFAK